MLNNIIFGLFRNKEKKKYYTTCSYCGVGCQFVVDKEKNNIVLKKDFENFKHMCIKGLTLIETQNKGRLLKTLYRENKNNSFKEIKYKKTIEVIADKLKNTKPEKIAFYSAGQVLTEDYYIFNKFFKGFIGTANVDSNSRTCISSALVALRMSIGDDYITTRMEEVLNSDLLIIAGANPADAHVVFYDKYIKTAKKQGTKVVVIDPIYTKTAQIADLYIQINPGTDLIFNNCTIAYLLQKKKLTENYESISKRVNNWEEFYSFYINYNYEKELQKTGVSLIMFKEFVNGYLLKNENIISITAMGYNQSYEGVYKNISLLNIHILLDKIAKPGNGYLPETGQSNAMGGREVSGLANLLAVHLDYNEANRKKVANFWEIPVENLPKKPGKTILEIMNAADKGEIEVLIVCHTDPIYSLPNRNKMEKIFKKIPFVVEINAYENTETSKFVNLRIPAKPWGEKRGRQTNLDRKISFQETIYEVDKTVKKDWEIIRDIAIELGYQKFFNYKNEDEIFNEFKKMTKLMKTFDNYSKLKLKKLYNSKDKKFIWKNKTFESKRKFFTSNKKSNLIVTKDNFISLTNNDYPLTLISYRIKEHWNSGSKTLLSKTIVKKAGKEGYVAISVNTLKNIFGYIPAEGINITIESKTGKIKLPLKIKNSIHEDCIAIPTFERKINYLTDENLFDPFSKQPAYNSVPVKIYIEK